MKLRSGWLLCLMVAAWACDSSGDFTDLARIGTDGGPSTTNPGSDGGSIGTSTDGGGTQVGVDGSTATGSDAGSGGDTGTVSGNDSGTTTMDASTQQGGGCTGAKICDDFETYNSGGLPTAPWTTDIASATMAIDNTKAFSGKQSVHITTNGGGAKALMIQTGVFPFTGNNIYGRYMLFYNVMPTTHYHMVILNGSSDTDQMTMGGLEGSKALFNFGPGDNTAVSSTVYPPTKWDCIQFQFDGPNSTAKMSINGTALTDNVVTNWQAFTVAKMSMGLLNCCDDTPKVDMWIDAVAVDQNPVACP